MSKLQNVSRLMHRNLALKRQGSEEERLRYKLDVAVAEQDFVSARRLRDELRQLVPDLEQQQQASSDSKLAREANTTQTSAIFKRIDMAWLESEIGL